MQNFLNEYHIMMTNHIFVIIVLAIVILCCTTTSVERFTAGQAEAINISIVAGRLTSAEKNAVDDILKEESPDVETKEKSGFDKRIKNQKVRWHAVAKKNELSTLTRGPDGVLYWVKCKPSDIRVKVEEAAYVQKFVSTAAAVLMKSWGKDDVRHDRASRLLPQKMNGHLISPILSLEGSGAMANPPMDVISFQKSFVDETNVDIVALYGAKIQWEIVLLHEIAHFISYGVPGSGDHSLIFFMIMKDMLLHLARAGVVKADVEFLNIVDDIENPMHYGLMVPGGGGNWKDIRRNLTKWKKISQKTDIPGAEFSFRIAYKELGEGKGSRYTLLCKLFPKLCAYFDRTDFWSIPPRRRPF